MKNAITWLTETYRVYGKALVVVLVAAVQAFVAARTDGAISKEEWLAIAVSLAGAAAVFTAPNIPGAEKTKEILAVITAALTVLTSTISNGLTPGEVWMVALAILGALGVPLAPGQSTVAASSSEK